MADGHGGNSNYAELGYGADLPIGIVQSATPSPEIGPTPVPSRPESPAVIPPEQPKQRERGRVRFNNNHEMSNSANRRSQGGALRSPLFGIFPRHSTQSRSRTSSVASLLRNAFDGANDSPNGSPERGNDSRHTSPSPIRRPRPSVLRNNSFGSVFRGEAQVIQEEEVTNEKASSAMRAHERAQKVATSVGTHSSPASPNSVDGEEPDYFSPRANGLPVRIDDIPLSDFDRQKYGVGGVDGTSENHEGKRSSRYASEAKKIVRAHTTRKAPSKRTLAPAVSTPGEASGRVTPDLERGLYEDYVPRPDQFRGSVLTSLLKLYNTHNPPAEGHSRRGSGVDSAFGSQPHTPGSSGMNTPQRKKDKWHQKNATKSQDNLAAGLMQASAMLGEAATPGVATPNGSKPKRPAGPFRSMSDQLMTFTSKKKRNDDEIMIVDNIADYLSRQKYIIKICQALMTYGAPTHRLEEYMRMTSRVLQIDGHFLYLPGYMIVSFDDQATNTSQVKLIRANQGIDLSRLKDVHEIYKEVVHDCIGPDEAMNRLDEIEAAPILYPIWLLVFCYGCASALVAPFAFGASYKDIPICFLLGIIVGTLQLIVVPTSVLYNNVFEITAAIITSFLARAFGSLRGGDLFCFSALAQSGIIMILPGWMLLMGSFELQSRSIIAGSVRMFYAIIFAIMLGFGIAIGTALYGYINPNATSATTCRDSGIHVGMNFLFVFFFALTLCFIQRARIKQMPIMVIIAMFGYVVSFFGTKKFPSSVTVSGALAAFAIGFSGNLYSRLRHGLAAAAILPAIMLQIPSGLAVGGSLLAGLSSADAITNATSSMNGTALNGTSTVHAAAGENLNAIVFNAAYSMIQVTIGMTVGLFLAALFVYPFGKRRSGLFSF